MMTGQQQEQQRNLVDFGMGFPQPSATSDRIYVVVWSKEKSRWICTDGKGGIGCEHERKRGEELKKVEPCRHIIKHRNNRLEARLRVLENQREWKSERIFNSFEQAFECLMHSKNEEISYLCNIALSFAYTEGKVTSDSVYEACGGLFQLKGVMGMAFRNLSQRGLLRHLGYVKSRTPTNNGAVIGLWELTPEGRAMFEGAM